MSLDIDAALACTLWREELLTMLERLEEIEQEAEEYGLLAVAHKVQEARGPLASAQRACPQYLDGTLEAEA